MTKVMFVVFAWRFMMKRSKTLRDLWAKCLQMIMSLIRMVPIKS